ncbi:dihydrofolate reductase family protein [Streptococcus ferus]|uniref:dihydrofolate reductase family protein n=1 Tax=Streptococcus ferus TaxID=1345 RepID=UPI0035A0C71F
MRNLVVFLHTSLDGIVEGPNGPMDIGFVRYNEELEAFANQVLSSAQTILWGRATYEMMYQYWPTMLDNPAASDHERRHAAWIDLVEKWVCSTRLESLAWNNASLLSGDIVSRLKERKNQEGGDIVVLGSPRLAKYLLKEKLVDTMTLTVSPVLVGGGLRLFEDLSEDLELSSSESLHSGVLCLTYRIKPS